MFQGVGEKTQDQPSLFNLNMFKQKTRKEKGKSHTALAAEAIVAAKEAKAAYYLNKELRAQERHNEEMNCIAQAEKRAKEKHALEMAILQRQLDL